jgi:hypothetical protein
MLPNHMKSAIYHHHFITLTYTDRKDPISGFLIEQNDDWTLVKDSPVDFVVDGYNIFHTQKIKSIRHEGDERFREEVIRLKGLGPTEEDRIPITDLATILNHLDDTYGIFELQTTKEDSLYLGRLISLDAKELVIESLDPNGKWDGPCYFEPSEIHIVRYATDYSRSLKLYADRKKRR